MSLLKSKIRSKPSSLANLVPRVTALALAIGLANVAIANSDFHPEMSQPAIIVDHDPSVFTPDPQYEDHEYDPEAQKRIYGAKRAVHTPRPLLELGRAQYTNGPLTASRAIVGQRNRIAPALSVYGDWRAAVAYNENAGSELGQIATRLNLDIDLKLTGTERIHAFVRPLDQDGRFSRIEFGGNKSADSSELELNSDLKTLFFEGDLGSIMSGLTNSPSNIDMPFALGLMPLLFQNGVWLEDAFSGVAFTIPAKNSRRLNISNFDITFFAGLDKVSNEAIRDANGNVADDDVKVYGIATFWEALEGYAEIDYAFIDGQNQFNDLDHHSFSAAFTSRWKDISSNSIRVIKTFGQDPLSGIKTAGGTLLILENSLITSKPSTVVPYFNLYAGFDRPQSVARDNGGLLKTIGINFETDALTGFPLLDDSGQDSWGGALGIQNLFALDQQLVVEVAVVIPMDENKLLGKAKGDQIALGVRYQRPLSRAWLVRADAMHGWLDNDDNISGVRLEIRRKF